MMKVSDPIMFGHAVEVYFEDAFAKHGAELKAAGANPNNGLAAVYSTIESMPSPKREEVQTAFATAAAARPSLAYVDSHKGITNLHVPSGACHRALRSPATPSLPCYALPALGSPATPSLPCYALLAPPALLLAGSPSGRCIDLPCSADVIIDASMPNVIRDSGKMWNKDDALEDVMAIIPDRCYATMYQVGAH